LDKKLPVAFVEKFRLDADGCGETHAVSARPSRASCRADRGIDRPRGGPQGAVRL
jgi:hypothetical protein